MAENQTHQHPLDRSGITVSAICLVHCLATPLLAVLVPAFEEFHGGEDLFHRVAALLILAIGSVAFYRGYLHHRKQNLLALGASGFLVVAIGLFQSSHIEVVAGLNRQSIFMIIGSLILITAHVLNIRACDQCTHAH